MPLLSKHKGSTYCHGLAGCWGYELGQLHVMKGNVQMLG